MKITGYGHSVVGSRDNNEDSWIVCEQKPLFAVADGVGGGEKGEVASKIAVTHLQDCADAASLNDTFRDLQRRVIEEAMHSVGAPMMGTTLTAVWVEAQKAHVCHVGDSRCYIFRGSHLELLTEDQEFYDETAKAPVLGSYLGIPEDLYPLTILEYTAELRSGEGLLLCSDGLYRQLIEPRICEIIKAHLKDPAQMVKALCEEASQAEYSDNVTVVFVTVE